jgi:KaiC/GvpD/RAD55 family RecA-like ATPase
MGGLMFESSGDKFKTERAERVGRHKKLLKFGVSFVDDSLLGILPDDLILVGAPSGVGKTQFVVNMALANVSDGKRVHFFALEASELEIERRLKWQVLTTNFYGDKDRPRIGKPLLFDEWEVGLYDEILEPYEAWAEEYCATAYKNLNTFYKGSSFDVNKLIEYVNYVADDTDLIVVDHVHYFDFDDSNENRAIKEIAKTARKLNQEHRKPIVLVSHLRKRDKKNEELAAGLDEFHGSSDLTKIATKVLSLAPGGPAVEGGFYTYMRTAKNRHSGSSSRYLAQIVYDEKRGGYGQDYKLGWANAQKFGEIAPHQLPQWMGRSRDSGGRSRAN